MRITLREFKQMLDELPERVLDKEVEYIDISWIDSLELPELKTQLESSKEDMICLCN